MNWIKTNWKLIVIGVLVLFSLNKCTVSCTRGTQLNKAEQVIEQKDSVISTLNDSIKTLNNTIAIYNEKIAGMKNAAEIQEEAIRKVTEAKKNISVRVNAKN